MSRAPEKQRRFLQLPADLARERVVQVQDGGEGSSAILSVLRIGLSIFNGGHPATQPSSEIRSWYVLLIDVRAEEVRVLRINYQRRTKPQIPPADR